MAEIVRAIESDTGNVVNLDLTPGWSKDNPGDTTAQQAVTEGNAKYLPDQRQRGKPCPEIPAGFAPPRGWNGCSHGFFAPHLVWPVSQQVVSEPTPPPAVKRGRGRPKGSKNKSPKPGTTGADSRAFEARAACAPVAPPSLADTPGPAVEVIDPAKLAAVIKALKEAGLV